MRTKYQRAFDHVAASDRLKEEVRNMTKQEKRVLRRQVPRALIAAALVALLVWITWIRRSMPLAAAGSWNRFTGSFSLIWTMTVRAVSWKSAAAPGRCRSVRP